MTAVRSRDVVYEHDGTQMIGLLCAPANAEHAPTVVLVHDAFGLGEDMIAIAHKIARLGYTVFAADVWGDRTTVQSEPEIGPLMGGMVGDRPRWQARIAAAHESAAAQPEVDGDALVTLGYCFGGSSALEHARLGGRVRGVISIHAGLDLIEFDWSAGTGTAQVLICTGAADPMATAAQREQLQNALSGAGVDWQLELYSDTVHAFTSQKAAFSPAPEVFAYHPRNAERAWQATVRQLAEIFPDMHPDSPERTASSGEQERS